MISNKSIPLYIVPALIWGSTWYVITFQLGKVDPLISVVYRYLIAGTLMMSYCLVNKLPLKFSLGEHFFLALQGMFLFGFNYWMAYEAELYITSGLMAVAFSTIVFANSIFGFLLLRKPINKRVMIGALFGLTGTLLIFSSEFIGLDFSSTIFKGASIAIFSVLLASLGNISSARNSASGIPVIQANTYGMIYGGISMALVALIIGRPFTFDLSIAYVGSLAFLVIFGSITAFGFYLTLVSKIGADKAAYALVIIPIISIAISFVFEDYQLTLNTVLGIILIITGNIIALRKKSKS